MWAVTNSVKLEMELMITWNIRCVPHHIFCFVTSVMYQCFSLVSALLHLKLFCPLSHFFPRLKSGNFIPSFIIWVLNKDSTFFGLKIWLKLVKNKYFVWKLRIYLMKVVSYRIWLQKCLLSFTCITLFCCLLTVKNIEICC